jgi:calcium-translocating P-type ATPase
MTAVHSSHEERKAGSAAILDHAAIARDLEIVHSCFGRLRVHLPHWSGNGVNRLLARIKRLRGVTSAEASQITRNVLIQFNPRQTTPKDLMEALRTLRLDLPATDADEHKEKIEQKGEKKEHREEKERNGKKVRKVKKSRRALPSVVEEGSGRQRRARISVRGLDRDTGLAHKVMQELQKKTGVHVEADLLTGRILVDYDHHLVHLQDLVAKVAELEMPEVPGEDEPRHPLDPLPYLQSATHVVGALLGLSFITVRRLFWGASHGDGVAAATVGVVTMVEGFPFVRKRIHRLLGENRAEVLTHGLALVAITLADFPLGLVMTGAEALLLLGEVTQRRAAWRNYEEGLDARGTGTPGSVLRLEPGMRVPHAARIIEGTGTAIARSGRVQSLAPGLRAPAGARLNGGPFVLELLGGETFEPQERPAPPEHDEYRRYLRVAAPVGLGIAALTGVFSGSFAAMFEALLLLNPRPALVGLDAANLSAAHRTLRAGLTIVGNPKRSVCQANVLLLDGPRMLTDGREIDRIIAVAKGLDEETLLTLAGSVAIAAGSPLGKALQIPNPMPATNGTFDGKTASAIVLGVKCLLRTATEMELYHLPDEVASKGGFVLALLREDHPRPLALIVTRPKLLPGVARLVKVCRQCKVELAVLPGRDTAAARRIADRAGVTLLSADDPVAVIRSYQQRGKLVAFASDGAHATQAFTQCDTSIGMTAGHAGYFPAQADILAPDLDALADFIESGRLRARAVRDSVVISAVSNVAGLALTLTGPIGIENAIVPGYVSALTALIVSWWRLRGGERAESTLSYLADPRPERWGRRPLPALMRSFDTTADGLSSDEASSRQVPPPQVRREEFLSALGKQFRAPTIALMSGGACATLILGQPFSTAIIATLTGLNVGAGLWQEHQASRAAEALARLSAPTARVLRDGKIVTIPASEVVTGDILAMMPGDRVAADARVISAESLEIGEAVMTGEAVPVTKGPEEASDQHRMVLEGTDVVAGSGRAIVVAVGRRTRLGATASALNANTQVESPLGARLARVLQVGVPVALTGGLITAGAAGVYGLGTLQVSAVLGLSTFLSTIPEGLPMLAALGQVAVSRRLAKRNAIVRRMAGIEALGRVDIACADKTGTLTEGRLTVSLVANVTEEVELPGTLSDDLRRVLLIGGLACPHPDTPGAEVHPTDMAMIRTAKEVGWADELRARHEEEMPFTAARAYHASRVGQSVCVKGSPERLIFRCKWLHDRAEPLDDRARRDFLKRTAAFAERGLRVLLVAEGPASTLVNDPEDMTALGIVGFSDPLRPDVPAAVANCQQAGIRIIMLTGDHPLTATAIGRQAGLFTDVYDKVYTASQLHDIAPDELDRRLASAAVIARATPLDKLHIVENLQQRGHTVAMTGDGVNDAPALRLADVGVAMGRTGSEVARQAADVVLIDDDFTTLSEALVESRSFWRNMRHALGLMLGGNAGELALMAGATAAGLGVPLSAPQILAVSLITDTLPSLAITLRPPMQHDLSRLAREGLSGLDASLPRDTLRRGLATAAGPLAAYLWTSMTAGPLEANAVAFASVVSSQLAQTLDAGHVDGLLSKSVVGAVGGSLALLGLAAGVPGVGELLGLQALSLSHWGTVGLSAALAVAISRSLTFTGQIDVRAFLTAWSAEVQRLLADARRLLPPPETAALPAPV